MKRLMLLMVLLTMVLSIFAAGCQRTAHDRYRDIMYRRSADADVVGFKDDVDACFLQEHPTHLSPWYNR